MVIGLLVVFGFFAIAGFLIYKDVAAKRARTTNNNTMPAGLSLRADASIVDINTIVASDNQLETTVTFSDGYKFISTRAKSRMTGLNRWQNYVDEDVRKLIVQDAFAKHSSFFR